MKKQFKKVYIEITNICNLTCEFCPRDKRRKEYMTKEKFEYILNQISPYTDYIYLHIKGEPLIHPEVNKLINIAYSKNFNINLTTNGTMIDNLRTKNIRQINYSIQSSNNVDQIRNIIEKLRVYIKDTNIYLSLRLWSNKSKNNLKIHNMLKEQFNIMEEIKDGICIENNVYISIEDEFKWPNIEDNKFSNGFCYGLKDQIGILVDGTVVPCCLDNNGDINLGNIFEKDLSEILNSDRVMNIIDGFKNRKPCEELCKKCSFKSKF